MLLRLAFNVQAEVASASTELGTGSTDVHQHFWLGPQFVKISGIHFRSPSECVWLEQMFVRCDHPEWSLPCSEPISVPSRARFLFVWWPLVIKCFLPLSLVYFLWHQREDRERMLRGGLSCQQQSLNLLPFCMVLTLSFWTQALSWKYPLDRMEDTGPVFQLGYWEYIGWLWKMKTETSKLHES